MNKPKETAVLKVFSETRINPVCGRLLTHQRTEGNDRQESLNQDAEPVRQSSVIAAVRIRLVDVGHVRDFQNAIVQESFHQEDPAVSVHVHVDAIKTRQPWETKGALPSVGEEGLHLSLLEENKPPNLHFRRSFSFNSRG